MKRVITKTKMLKNEQALRVNKNIEMQWDYVDYKGGLTTPEWCYSSKRAADLARGEG